MALAQIPFERIPIILAWVPGTEVIPKRKPRATKPAELKSIEYGGVRRTLHEWSRLRGISYDTINQRLHRGWTPAQALGYEAREPRTAKLRRIIHAESQRAIHRRQNGSEGAYKGRRGAVAG